MNRFAGTDRNGTARGGGTDDPAALAERCYDRGWRWLRITDTESGEEVGGIKLSSDHPRRRIWWAQSTAVGWIGDDCPRCPTCGGHAHGPCTTATATERQEER